MDKKAAVKRITQIQYLMKMARYPGRYRVDLDRLHMQLLQDVLADGMFDEVQTQGLACPPDDESCVPGDPGDPGPPDDD